MTPERWRQVTDIFHAARARETAGRDAFVADACRDDPALRREVDAMLAANDAAGNFGEMPLRASASQPGPAAAPTAELAPGSFLGPYRILGALGAGGMGQVYKAFDPQVHREVAIKVAAERFSERFEREVRLVATLNHPNICTLHAVGPDYLVMELVEGETLRAWFTRALPLDQSLHVARQILEALRAAHGAGIVHRDLKPENVMVRFDGYVKVLDFGLAERIQSALGECSTMALPAAGGHGLMMGTIPYMSPEQIEGRDLDQRSDLFALGIILYEMLAGRHPWPRGSRIDTLHAILHDAAPPIHAPSLVRAELAAIVQKLLRKSRAERYASAEAVLGALGSRTSSRASSPAAAVAPSPAPLTSIAVLPFLFLSEVDDRKGLSLGFADALITMLGRLDDVSVLPTSAILNYAAGTDPAGAARDLGTRHVLQGNVQKLGDRWRVSMHLFDAMAQATIASDTHDFVLQDVFEVQDEIGRQVVASLRRRFPAAAPTTRDRYSSDPAAYDAFMAGLRDSYADGPDALERAIGHLTRALERDPDFALAHAWLSYVSTNVHFSFDSRQTRLEKAEHHCRLALELDPALPEAHLARAFLLWSPAKGFQHLEALAALEQVLTVQPNLEQAHNRVASICLHIGRLAGARAAHERAVRSNAQTRSRKNLEFLHLYSGDFARAEEAGEAWIEARPTSTYARFFHAQPALLSGNLDLAATRLTAAAQQLPDEPLIISLQGMLHARRGEAAAALDCVRRALDRPRSFGHTHHTYYQLACVHAVLGDTAIAMGWLERSIDTGFACWPFFAVDPYLESLRGHPGFISLLADLEEKYAST